MAASFVIGVVINDLHSHHFSFRVFLCVSMISVV